MRRAYSRLATRLASAASSHWAPVLVVLLIAGWVVAGLALGFSQQWQLVLNTAAILVTLLMVFLLQHAQRKDTLAVQLKLDELLDALEAASERLIGSERLDAEELSRLREERAPRRRR
ncbi:MAG: low affinity iron permease family protein [Halobacteriales archaeon]|nr:low affinity iron permease family protein [Halobacteriales archaeon]